MSSPRVFLVKPITAFACALLFLSKITFAIGLNPGGAGGGASSKAALLIDKKPAPLIGRSSCDIAEENAEIANLSPEVLQNTGELRVLRKQASAKEKSSPCPSKISENDEGTFIIQTATRTFAQGHLLSKGECGMPGRNGVYHLCIYPSKADSSDKLIAEAIYRFSTKVTRIISVDEKSAYNGEATFTIISDGAATEFEICYRDEKGTPQVLTDDADCPETGWTSLKVKTPNVKINGLTDRTKYTFKVRILSPSKSKWFEAFDQSPTPTAFPLAAYEGKGGEFSCQTTNKTSGIFFLAVLAAFLMVRARRKAKPTPQCSLLLIAIFSLSSTDGHAEFGQVNVGLLGSPYLPDIDSELKSSGTPISPFYKCFFCEDQAKKRGPITPLLGAEMDFHLWDDFGSLQLGLGFGYSWASGFGLELDNNNQPLCDKPNKNAPVKLHMFQFRPQMTYLFSPFAEDFPLFPYFRGALIAQGYTFTTNGKLAEKTTNSVSGLTNKPRGFRFGYQAEIGLMLMLDFLEPGAIRRASNLKHVYLKTGLAYEKVDSFGRQGFQFSPKDIMGTPLPLLWTFGLVFELP